MTIERAIPAGTLDHLLASPAPRALWTGEQLYPNKTFRQITGFSNAEDVERACFDAGSNALELLNAVQTVTRGETAGDFLLRGYRAFVTPVPEGARLVALVELRDRDVVQASLASIVPAYERASNWEAELSSFIGSLTEVPDGLFSRVIVARSRPGEPFISIGGMGHFAPGDRSWLRWPLRRLYHVRRAARITNPSSDETAIAFPMQHGDERTVVLAVIAQRVRSISENDLLMALEALRFVPSDGASEDVADIASPRFLWIGAENRAHTLLRQLIERRGWQMFPCPRIADIRQVLGETLPDVILFNADRVPNAGHVLRTLRGAIVGQTPIIGIGTFEIPHSEAAALCDGQLGDNARPDIVLETVKTAVRNAVAARRREAREQLAEARRELQHIASFRGLARLAAERCARFIDGWAAVHLVDEKGRMTAAESPLLRGSSLLPHLPESFISGETIVRTHLDHSFYEAITSEPRRADAIRAMRGSSGVIAPVIDADGRTVGVVTAIGTRVPRTPDECRAVVDFAAAVGARHSWLRSRPPELASGVGWRRGSLGGLDFASFVASATTLCVRLVPIDGQRSALVACERASAAEVVQRLRKHIAPPDALWQDRGFAGIANAVSGTLTFAVNDFPPPLLLSPSGPSGAISTSRGGKYAGSINLRSGAGVVITDAAVPLPVECAADVDEFVNLFESDSHEGVVIALAMRSPIE